MAAGISSGQRRARTPGGRAVRVVVRVTAEEYASLAVHAQQAGTTVPSYLATLGLHPDDVPIAELRSALTHAAALRRLLSAALTGSEQHPTGIQLAELQQRAAASVTRLTALTAGHRSGPT
jgi:hypothetical protein